MEEFDRSLYLFVCIDCWESNNGWMVVRNQKCSSLLPTKAPADEKCCTVKQPSTVWDFLDSNEASNSNIDENFDDLLSLLAVRDAALSPDDSQVVKESSPKAKPPISEKSSIFKAFSSSFLSEDFIEVEVSFKRNLTRRDGSNKAEFDDDDYENDIEDDGYNDHIHDLLDSYLRDEEDPTVVALLTGRNNNESSLSIQGDENRGDEDNGDRALSRSSAAQRAESLFMMEVSQYPKQLFRYDYGGPPLWCKLTPEILFENGKDILEHSAQKIQVPCCSNCGQPRSFEMQLMPYLSDMIRKLDKRDHLLPEKMASSDSSKRNLRDLMTNTDFLDYGTVAIFSCPSSCHHQVLAKEFVYVQMPSDVQ